MLGRLASLFVEIDAKTTGVDSGLARVGSRFAGLGLVAGAALAAVGAGVAVAVGKAVKGASDLQESLSKTDAVFGESSAEVKAFADDMAREFGFVKREVLDAEARFAGLGKGIANLSGADLTGFTNEFTKLAADMASFQNISFEEAVTALSSGLSGETEPLKRFGVVLTEAQVQAKAYAMGLAKVGAELTEQQKIQARSAFIMEKTRDMQGDLARTSGGFANQSRKLWGTLQNTLTDFGAILMPIAARILGVFNAVAGAIAGFVERNGPALTAFAEGVGAAFDWMKATVVEVFAAIVAAGVQLLAEIQTWAAYTAAVDALAAAWQWLLDTGRSVFAALGAIYRNFGTFAAIVFVTGKQYAINLAEAIAWFAGVAGQYLAWFGRNWVRVFSDAFNAALTIVKNFALNVGSNIKALWDYLTGNSDSLELSWTPLLDGFEATMEKLPEVAAPVFTSLQGEIDALGRQMADAEGRHADAMAKAKEKAKEATAPKKGDEAKADAVAKKAAEAKFVALDQMAKDIQAAALGKDKDAKRAADGIEKLVVEQKGMRSDLKRTDRTARAS